jgi:hypothetical protein
MSIPDTQNTIAPVETIDKSFGKDSEAADNLCKCRRPAFYSLPLVQQRLKVSALTAHITDLHLQKQSRLPALQARLTRAGIILEFPGTLTETWKQHKLAQKELRALQSNHAQLCKTELSAKKEAATHMNQPTVAVAPDQ